jgi:hypothetical protein
VTAPNPSLPLRYRVPAPVELDGREAELADLEAMSRNFPLIVIAGLGGMGKTSLATAFVHRRSPRTELEIFAAIAPNERLADLVSRVANALAEAAGIAAECDPTDVERALAFLVDVADSHRALVVLDGLDALREADATALVDALAAHLRRARAIVTSRSRPRSAEIAGQTLALGPLDGDALAALVSRVRPGFDAAEIAAVVARAAGSPLRARQLASGQPTSDRDVLGGLDDAAVEIAEALFAIEVPIARATLTRHLPEPALDALERRAVIERRESGVALTPAARELLRSHMSEDRSRTARRRAALVLDRAQEPA